MRHFAIAVLLCPFLAASALAQGGAEPWSSALARAQAEQASAEALSRKLEDAAAHARSETERIRAERAAAAQAIDAAEAQLSAANVRLQFVSASVAAHRRQLAAQQRPASSLLAGLALMARRPPLLAIADRGGTNELVKVRLLLDSTLPVIHRRTERLSAEVAEGRRLEGAALAARAAIVRSRDNLRSRQQRYAALERTALQRALASGGQALGASDAAMVAGEEVDRLRAEQANSRSMRMVAQQLANEPAAPLSPFAAEGGVSRPPFAYELPAAALIAEGLASVNSSGVRSRGLTMAAARGALVTAPAGGVIRFAGPFHDYDGVLIIDHGGGWLSLIVNVASERRAGDRVRLGDGIGRALGPLQVELSRNGRQFSPALIAGSSQSLSKDRKGS